MWLLQLLNSSNHFWKVNLVLTQTWNLPTADKVLSVTAEKHSESSSDCLSDRFFLLSRARLPALWAPWLAPPLSTRSRTLAFPQSTERCKFAAQIDILLVHMQTTLSDVWRDWGGNTQVEVQYVENIFYFQIFQSVNWVKLYLASTALLFFRNINMNMSMHVKTKFGTISHQYDFNKKVYNLHFFIFI